jgi:hypothetical protein
MVRSSVEERVVSGTVNGQGSELLPRPREVAAGGAEERGGFEAGGFGLDGPLAGVGDAGVVVGISAHRAASHRARIAFHSRM